MPAAPNICMDNWITVTCRQSHDVSHPEILFERILKVLMKLDKILDQMDKK